MLPALFVIASLLFSSTAWAAEGQTTFFIMLPIFIGWGISIFALLKSPKTGVLLASVGGLLVSGYLSFKAIFPSDSSWICSAENGAADCASITQHAYGNLSGHLDFLPGYPLSVLGTALFAAIFLLALQSRSHPERYKQAGFLIAIVGAGAVLFSLYLAVLVFIGLPKGSNIPSGIGYLFSSEKYDTLNSWCPYCVGMYGFNLLVFIGGILWAKQTEKGSWSNALIGNEDSSIGLVGVSFFLLVGISSIWVFKKSVWSIKIIDADIKVQMKKSKSLGSPDAKIKIVEFVDFRCGHCAEATPVVKKAYEKFSDDVQLTLRHYPLGGCEIKDNFPVSNSCMIAVGTECAAIQGKYWDVASRFFEKQDAMRSKDVITGEVMLEFVSTLGLDEKRFSDCVDNPRMIKIVQKDIETAERFGLKGTPSLYLQGIAGETWYKVSDWENLDSLLEKIIAGEQPPADLEVIKPETSIAETSTSD